MLKALVILSVVAACLALPSPQGSVLVDPVSSKPSEEPQPSPSPDGAYLIDPVSYDPSESGEEKEEEGKSKDDLKTDPTFWFGYGHGYPYYRRSFYYPSFYSHYGYYGYPSYHYSPYSYYW